jgi:hypothetical protein
VSEVKIYFNISEQTLQDLEKLLGKDALNKLGKEAFTEWVNWLQGKQRRMTVPDLEAYRVFTIYDEILVGKLPSSSQLSSSLSLPPSRGQYIARSIREQHPQWWRKRLLEMALRDCGNSSKKLDDITILVITDSDCKIIFDQLFQRLADDGLIRNAKRRGKREGNTIRYKIGVDAHKALMKTIQEDLESIKKTQIGE